MFGWLRLNPTFYAVSAAVLLAMLMAFYAYGRRDGFALAQIEYQAALIEAQKKAEEQRALADLREKARLTAQAAADAAAQQLEDQANADNSGSDACLSPGRVRRLQGR